MARAQSSWMIDGWQESLEAAIGKVTAFQKSQMPFILEQTLNKHVRPVLLENERKEIRDTFTRYNRFTENSPIISTATKRDTSIVLKHFDDASATNRPSHYLAPQVTGGRVYVTRFNYGLRAAGIIESNEYVLHWGEDRGPAAPPLGASGAIGQILSALKSEDSEYFVLGSGARRRDSEVGDGPDTSIRPDRADDGYEGPGVYRRRKASSAQRTQGVQSRMELVFRLLRATPTVEPKYEWNLQRIGPVADEAFAAGIVTVARDVLGLDR